MALPLSNSSDVNVASVHESLTTWLSSYDWQYFFTITFRRPELEYKGERVYDHLNDHTGETRDAIIAKKRILKYLYESRVDRAFLAIERGNLSPLSVHAHGLMYEALPRLNAYDYWKRFYARWGRAQVSEVRGIGTVSAYCAKYVSKSNCDWDVLGGKNEWSK